MLTHCATHGNIEIVSETTSDLWLDFLHEAQTGTDHWGPTINVQIWNGGMTMSRHTDLIPTSARQSISLSGAFRITLKAKPTSRLYGQEYYPSYELHNPGSWQ